MEFVAKETGDTGSAIRVTIGDGSEGDKRYTVTDGSTTEVYDSVALADLEVEVQDSALIEVWILADLEANEDIEPDNTAATNLLGGSERSETTCSVVGIAEKEGHRRVKSDPITIPLARGQIKLVAGPQYGGMVNPDGMIQLPVNGRLDLQQDGHPGSAVAGTWSYSYEVEGYVPGTTEFISANTKAGVCTVENDDSSSDFGRVSAGNAAGVGDICRLSVTVGDDSGAHRSAQANVNFVLTQGSLTFATAPTLDYGSGRLKIGTNTPLGLDVALPTQDESDTPLDVLWRYEVTGWESDGSTEKEGVCQVDTRLKVVDMTTPMTEMVDHDNDPQTPDVTNVVGYALKDNPDYGKLMPGMEAIKTDICRVTAYATSPGYSWYQGDSADVTVNGNDLLFTRAGTKPTIVPEELRLSGSAAPDITTTRDDNGVDVAWSGWRVVGDDVDGTDDTTDGDVCTIDPATGAVTLGDAASVDDTCAVYATAGAATLGDYYEEQEIQLMSYTLKAVGTFANITAPVYDVDGLLVGGYPLSLTTAPGMDDTTSEVMWSYAAVGKRGGTGTANICSVDADEGVVTPGSDAAAGDTCEITASATANGYTGASAPLVTLTVKDTFNSLAWTNFPASATVGTSIDLSSNQPVSDPAGSYAISVDSGDCTYDNSDVLSFSDTTACVIRVVASKTHYVDKAATFTVTPTAGTIALAGADDAAKWGTYAAVVVGAQTSAPATGTISPAGVAKAYALASDSAGCRLGTGGAITGTVVGTDNCKVVLTLTQNRLHHSGCTPIPLVWGREPLWWRVRMRPPSGEPMGRSKWIGIPTLPLSAGTTPNTGVSKAYALANDSSGCTVNASSGTVSGTGAGTDNCKVVVTLSATHYNDLTHTYTISVGKANQTKTAIASWSNPYGSASPSITFGSGSNTVAITSTQLPVGQVALEYQIKSGSHRNYCSVDAGTGTVTAKAAGAGNRCDVEARFGANANYNASGWQKIATVSIQAGTIDLATTPTLAYATPLRFGDTTTQLAPSGLVNSDDNSVAMTWEYSVQGRNSADNRNKSNVCALVNATPGHADHGKIVLGSRGNVGNICRVSVVGRAAGYSDYTAVTSVDLTVQQGIFTALVWSDFPATATVGVSTTALGAPVSTPAASSYTFSVSGGCSYNESSRVLSFSNSTACSVTVTASKNNYTDRTKTFTVTPGAGAILLGARPTLIYTGTLRFGDTTTQLVPSGLVSSDANSVSLTWHFSVQGRNPGDTQDKDNVCALASSTVGHADYGKVVLGSAAAVTDICRVSVVAQATGYNDYTEVLDVDLVVQKGTFTSITWATFPTTTQRVGVPMTAGEAVAVPQPSSYQYTDVGSSCTYNSNTGVLTFADGGVCTIRVTVSKDNYENFMRTFTVPVDSADFVFATAPTLTYTGSLTYGDTTTLLVPSALPGQDDNGIEIQWEYSVQGRNSDDTADKDNVCTTLTISDIEHANYGKVGLGSAAAGGDICRVTVEGLQTGYNGYKGVADVDLVVGKADQVAPDLTGWTTRYAASSVAVGASALTLTTTAAPTGQGALAYSTTTAANCSVDASTGAVTGKGAGAGSNCVVQVNFTGNGNYNASSAVTLATIGITEGTMNVSAWGSYASVVVGAETDAPTITSTPTAVSASYALASGSAGCTVTNAGGVTGTTVGTNTCKIEVTLSATGYGSVSHIYTISVGLGSITVSDWGSYASIAVGANTDAPSIASTTSSLSAAYSAASDSAGCTVTSAGVVTGTAVGTDTCKVVVTLTKTGYNSESHTYTMSVSKGSQTPPTGTNVYGASAVLNVGGRLSVIDAPTGGQGPLRYRSLDTAKCTVNNTNGRVTGVAAGRCQIQAKWNGNTNWSESGWSADLLDVTVGTDTFTAVDWSGYTGSTTYGRTRTLVPPTSTPAADSWTYTTANAYTCTVDSSTGAVVMVHAGTCRITAVPVKAGYPSPSGVQITFRILPSDQAAPVWTGQPYGANPTVVQGSTLILTGSRPVNPVSGGGALQFEVFNSGNRCTVNRSNGRVTAGSSTGNCTIRARYASVTNRYHVSSPTTIATVRVVARQFVFNGTPSLTYDGNLVEGDTTTLLTPSLPATDTGGASITWHYTLQGRNSGDTQNKANVCTLASSTVGNANYGKVKLGTAATGGDICRVSVVGRASGYADYTRVSNVDLVVTQTLSFNTVPTITTTGSPSALRDGGTDDLDRVTLAALPTSDNSSPAVTGITWRFRVQGFASNGSTPKDICYLVDPDDPSTEDHRKVGLKAGHLVGDICRVSVVGEKTGYADYTAVPDLDMVVQL